jgi:hypothetical protein
MKNEHLIEQCNSKRSKIFYRLNQLEQITGLSPRMLKYKMKLIKVKYANIPSLLRKEGKCWKIHLSIVDEFMPIRKRKSYTESNYEWKTFATWNTKCFYTEDYHYQMIYEIKKELSNYLIRYTVETDGRDVPHPHFITDASEDETKRAVSKVLLKYMDESDVITKISSINNKYSSVSYTNKAPLVRGLI